MSNRADWVADAIQEARSKCTQVPNSLWVEAEELLRGKLSQRSIPAVELAKTAMQLIESVHASGLNETRKP